MYAKGKIKEINNLEKENNQLVIYSKDVPTALQEINYYFSLKHQPQLSNCSLLIIKPHIIESGNAGKLVDIN